MSILEKYTRAKTVRSDIYEHMPTLLSYAEKCNHITEAGVRKVVSSYAFALGLKGKTPNKLIQIDIKKPSAVSKFITDCSNEGINVIFYEESDLTCPLEPTELLFIDTWHVYGQLKRELDRWNPYVSKYIIMHDTTTDGVRGESLRYRYDTKKQSIETGIPEHEIRKGLWPAIEEFLATHTEWKLEKRYTNNNGLTILSRVA
jgi:hypothetical protein